ncbi:biotin/lipoyl-binding protein [Niveibacterium sp. 24ML]|uniref:biotin/lipoyl-containing protein n=1 Tax=Niveibacterium sp. 24ML TaxID=2985512 RepID=UPI00226E2C18|nr:biotin/lipoyl-containing protein [Niveibacterium sp. 24ML]MCX9157231.1 biotin/lipoyl-binding protein [Niveibacterium sp. 24ML]
MERTFRITVDGQAFVVTVEEIDVPGAASPAIAAPSAAPHVGGALGHVPSAPPAAQAAPAQGAIISQLGGTVEAVHVKVGQQVAPGDHLLSIEAMKMKNAVLATEAGTVRSVEVAAGDAVAAGQVLLRLG